MQFADNLVRAGTVWMSASALLFAWGGPALAQSSVPTPESVLGHRPGDDFFLATYDESLEYFRRLDAASDKIQLVRVGETSFGADWHVALISSAENLAQLDRYKEIAQRLAWARGLDDAEARRLAQDGKAIVHIDGGLHATEAAHAQHTIQLAYDLVSSSDPQVEKILDEVILLLWFSINPDGQNLIANWYRRNLGTPFEVSPTPFLYQKYVGHDNNRDGYMNNMLESQVITRVTLEHAPQVFYNHHQTAPFPARIWIPPFAEPVSLNAHPLMWRWVNVFGTAMAAYLDERGMPGAIHRGRGFDDWYPGFIDHVNNFRNTVSFLTETALYRYATPHFYTVNDFPRDRQDLRSESLYASPWKGGWWRLGDAVRYMLGASMSVLDTTAKYRESLLYNRYQAGRDVIRRFTEEPPYGYVIPANQRDLRTAALLAEKMRINGLEVHQAARAFSANGRLYPAGSWVILMNQPFAALVKELFEIQDYPDLRDYEDGPPDLPYDVAGWTLPVQMGVEATAILTPLDEQTRAGFRKLDRVQHPSGSLEGSGSSFVFSRQSNSAVKAVNEILATGGKVRFKSGEHDAGAGPEHGALLASGVDRSRMRSIAEEHGLKVRAVADADGFDAELSQPRVGIYRPWAASIDEGWTRWILEDYGFEPTSVYNPDVIAGHLGERFDAIVVADIRGRTIMEGYKAGTIPAEYSGGITEKGLENLRQFVRQGGTLLAFNDSTLFVVEKFNLALKNVVKDLKNEEFFCSGSLLRVEIEDPSHPVVLGMPATPAIMFDRGPAFEAKPGFKGSILASFPEERNPLVSGFILHPEKIQGKAALVDADYGEGRVVLYGFRPQWRGQSMGTYKLIFNALYYRGLGEPEEQARQSARKIQLDIWRRLSSRVRQDLEKFVEANRLFNSARGSKALETGRKLDALIDDFQKTRLGELSELESAVEEKAAQEKLAEYASRLKSLLVDLRSKDFSAVDYSGKDLAKQYRLTGLEEEIGAALRGR